jgi:hypothetical protein
MGKLARAVAVLAVVGTPRAAVAGEVGFSADRWRFRAVTAQVEEKLGRQSLLLKNGHAYLNDVSFADGTLEADVAVPTTRTFVGLVFASSRKVTRRRSTCARTSPASTTRCSTRRCSTAPPPGRSTAPPTTWPRPSSRRSGGSG